MTESQSLDADRGYIVLRLNDAPGSEGRWDRVGREIVTAAGAMQAVRAVVTARTKNDQNGTFVAVPARSWKPVLVTAKTETKLVLEDAS